MRGEKVVVYSGNQNVYSAMYTALKSLLRHNHIDTVWLVIEDDEFPYKLPGCVKTINASKQAYFPEGSANIKTRFSFLALIRACYADMFPQYDKILSLDIDTIVTGDITPLWDIPLDDYYFAACKEPMSHKTGKHPKAPEYYEKQDCYYNVGVTMYNLKKQREDGIAEQNVRMLNETEYFSVEQDTLNLTCQGKIYPIPAKYNASLWTARPDDAVITHYAGIKLEQWRDELLPRKYAEMPIESVVAAWKKLGKKQKREERIVVYSGTRNLYANMITAMKSLLDSTYIDKVYMLVEDDWIDGIPSFVDNVECVNVSEQTYFPEDCPNAHSILTWMVLMRAAYHKIFPEHKKVLQLDVDTIVARDISGLWDYDMEDYYLAACMEPGCSKGGMWEKRDEYYNMGVAMMNLEKLRDGTGDKVIQRLNASKCELNEQGAFNELCAGKILRLPVFYNSGNPWTGYSCEPKVIHFAGDRAWQTQPMLRGYRMMRWEDIMERQKRWRST